MRGSLTTAQLNEQDIWTPPSSLKCEIRLLIRAGFGFQNTRQGRSAVGRQHLTATQAERWVGVPSAQSFPNHLLRGIVCFEDQMKQFPLVASLQSRDKIAYISEN
jgi:hypothetical protein